MRAAPDHEELRGHTARRSPPASVYLFPAPFRRPPTARAARAGMLSLCVTLQMVPWAMGEGFDFGRKTERAVQFLDQRLQGCA